MNNVTDNFRITKELGTVFELRIDMEDSQGAYRRVEYSSFSVGPAPDYQASKQGLIATEKEG